ncbi:hypothetical protein ACOMHN_001653 [Nucella lapillus]
MSCDSQSCDYSSSHVTLFRGMAQSLGLVGSSTADLHHGALKYSEHGHGQEAFDFVTLVCQDAQSSQSQPGHSSPTLKSPTKLQQFFAPGMLPPPPSPSQPGPARRHSQVF